MLSSTLDGLLLAILKNPADDTLRLIYADALEEYGDGERAEFCRVQVELESLRAKTVSEVVFGLGDRSFKSSKAVKLTDRERELLVANWPKWCPTREGFLCHNIQAGASPWIEFRRGFVAEVRCTLTLWCGWCARCNGRGHPEPVSDLRFTPKHELHCRACSGTGRDDGLGPAIVAAHPIERVECSDREPYGENMDARAAWYNAERPEPTGGHLESDLPLQLFSLLQGTTVRTNERGRWYDSASAAVADLSTALLAWAKGVRL